MPHLPASLHLSVPVPVAPIHLSPFPLTSHALKSSRITLSMSQAPSTMALTSSAIFQPIFNAALKAYEAMTKNNLLAHPLAAQLQACNSPDDILAILQDRVQEFDHSRSERLSRWLDPAINVLFAFSVALGGGVGLVGPLESTCPLSLTWYQSCRCSPQQT
jgi:hypothetical protein